MTSKKRKHHPVSGGPSEPQAPEMVLAPRPSPSHVISVIDLDGDFEGSPLAPPVRVQAATTQMVSLSTALAIKPPAYVLEAPSPPVMVIMTLTQVGSSSPPSINEEPLLGPGTWLWRSDPGGTIS